MKQLEENNLSKTYYSIIYLRPRPYVSEQFSIGIVLMNSNNILFRFSSNKIKQLKGILAKNQIETINIFLKNFQYEVNSITAQIATYNSQILPINLNIEGKINYDFLTKLSITYNNLIGFSEPIYIDLEINDGNFIKLFSKMIYSEDIRVLPKDNDFITTRKDFKKSISNKVNLDVKGNILAKELSLKPYEVPINLDALGMNGVSFTTQFIDFNADQLNNKILSYLTLIKQSSLNKGINFIVYNETTIKINQKIIRDLYNENFIKMKHINEIHDIKEYIDNNNVHQFISN